MFGLLEEVVAFVEIRASAQLWIVALPLPRISSVGRPQKNTRTQEYIGKPLSIVIETGMIPSRTVVVLMRCLHELCARAPVFVARNRVQDFGQGKLRLQDVSPSSEIVNFTVKV